MLRIIHDYDRSEFPACVPFHHPAFSTFRMSIVLVTGGTGACCSPHASTWHRADCRSLLRPRRERAQGARSAREARRALISRPCVQYVIESEPVGSRYGKATADEQWIFLSSKDGDLRSALVRSQSNRR